MPVASFSASRAVRVFVVLGVVASVFSAIVALKLLTAKQAELLRYQACAQGTRHDCDPSLFWVLAGLTPPGTKVSTAAVPTTSTTEGKHVVRTSDAAPLLTSLRPEGFNPVGTGYHITAGTKANLLATIENTSGIEARFKANGQTQDALLMAMTPVKDKENTYEAAFVWKETRSGTLEIRALGNPATEQTSLFIPITVTQVAKTK